jgi:uncharacterized protein (TIRG00374 family)
MSRRRLIGLSAGLAIAAGAVYAAISSAGSFSDAFDSLADASPRWAVLAGLSEAMSYVFVGVLLRRLLGNSVRTKTAVEIGLVLGGLGPLLPAAPAEGVTMATSELGRRGVPMRKALLAIALAQSYFAWAMVAVLALSILVAELAVQVRLPRNLPQFLSPTTLVTVAAVVLAGLLLFAWIVRRRRTAELVSVIIGRARFWRSRRPVEQLRARGADWHAEARAMLGSRRNEVLLAALAFLACVADLLCFRLALEAAHVNPRPGIFVIAYAATMIASAVPFLPAGIGVVESVVPTILLRAHTPFAVALAGLLVYRALALLLPAAAGAISAARLRLTPTPEPCEVAADTTPEAREVLRSRDVADQV